MPPNLMDAVNFQYVSLQTDAAGSK